MNTYKIIQSKIITRNSPKIEKTLTVEELKQHLKKTIPYAKVPVETLQAYNLVGNRHEKRAKIHKYAQQIGNTYADIMQKLNAEENISSYDLQNFANGINFLFENKQKITPNMITTLEKATKNVANQIESLLENQNPNIEPSMLNALAKGIDSLLSKNETKDFSYELKILSIGTLKNIQSDISQDNIEKNNIGAFLEKYETLYKTSSNINELLSGKKLKKDNNPKFTKDVQRLKSQYYYKEQDGTIWRTNHTPQELFNFMQSYKTLDTFYNAIKTLQENGQDLDYNLNTKDITNDINIAKPTDALSPNSNNYNESLVKINSLAINLKGKKNIEERIASNKSLQENLSSYVKDRYQDFLNAVTNKLEKQLKINKTLNTLSSLRKIPSDISLKLNLLKKEERTTLATNDITDINSFIGNFNNAKGSKNSRIELNNNEITLKEKKDETVTINISDGNTKEQFIKLLNNIKNTLCKGNGNTYATLVHIAHRILLRAPLNQTTEYKEVSQTNEKITKIDCQNLVKANEFVDKLGNILKTVKELNIRNTEIQEFIVDEQTYYLTACIDAKKGKYEHQTFNIFYKDKENQEIYNLNLNPQGGLMTFIDDIKFSDKEKYIEDIINK